jgi:drug/metabolite transporter (DMT)-like permease
LARIFLALSLFSIVLLVANIVIGFSTGDFNGIWQQDRDAYRQWQDAEKAGSPQRDVLRDKYFEIDKSFRPLSQRKTVHFLFGLVASLVAVLVNSITVTYFIGTSRWCREVVDRYGLDSELAERSNTLKRKTFPWSLGGIMVILAIVSLGAFADPSAWPFERSAEWVTPHYLAATIGTGLIAWSFLVQVGNIGANYEVIEQILSEVHRIRAERGLDNE